MWDGVFSKTHIHMKNISKTKTIKLASEFLCTSLVSLVWVEWNRIRNIETSTYLTTFLTLISPHHFHSLQIWAWHLLNYFICSLIILPVPASWTNWHNFSTLIFNLRYLYLPLLDVTMNITKYLLNQPFYEYITNLVRTIQYLMPSYNA